MQITGNNLLSSRVSLPMVLCKYVSIVPFVFVHSIRQISVALHGGNWMKFHHQNHWEVVFVTKPTWAQPQLNYKDGCWQPSSVDYHDNDCSFRLCCRCGLTRRRWRGDIRSGRISEIACAQDGVSLQRCFCRPAVLSMLVLMEGSVGQLNLQ